MAVRALSDFLQDFGRRPGQIAPGALAEEQKPVQPIVFEPREDDTERRIAGAVAQAEEKVTERVSRIYEGTLQAERDQHTAEVSALRTSLGTEAVATIAARLEELERQVTTMATSTAARILGVFLGDEMQRRTVGQLAAMIREAVNDRETVRIQVHGPQLLFEALSQALGARSAGIEFVESASFDLSVSVDGSLFETRLGEWSAAIEEAMR